jgi:LytR cell envelope-related transcriptional attenuator
MPGYVVYRPSVMRSGRLAVRAAAVAALLLAAITAFVLISRAGSTPQQSGRASSAAIGSNAQIAKAKLAGAHAARTKAAATGIAGAKAKAKAKATAQVAEPPVAPAHVAKKKKTHAAAIPLPKNTPVAVLNGGTAQGAAAALAARLRALGYPVPVVGNAGRRDLPLAIEYSAGLGPAARALAKHVGAVQYVTPLEGPNRNLSGARLLVIVGA